MLPRAQSLLSMYGIDELSDTDGESDLPDNPMSPEQIAMMRERRARAQPACAHALRRASHVRRHAGRIALSFALTVDRQIALTRELDIDDPPAERPGGQPASVPLA